MNAPHHPHPHPPPSGWNRLRRFAPPTTGGLTEIAGGPGLLRSPIDPSAELDLPGPAASPVGAPIAPGEPDDAALDRERIE